MRLRRFAYLLTLILIVFGPMSSHLHAAGLPAGMVVIPGGNFMMGCTVGDSECFEDEKPTHKVVLKAFAMDKTEVTVGAYRKCVEAGRCTVPAAKSYSQYCNWGYGDRDAHPVNGVNWTQAKAYCEWAGKRLPSEAEWEYAARGGHSEWKYPWGNENADCSRAVMDDRGDGCGKNSTWPAGSKGEYGFGLNDMAGNVLEWVEDCYHDDYSGAPTDGRAWVMARCDMRILRGGSWLDDPWFLRVSGRIGLNPGFWNLISGFRCAQDR